MPDAVPPHLMKRGPNRRRFFWNTIRRSRSATWVAKLTGGLDAHSVTLQRAADLIQNRRIVNRRRHRPRIAVCNFLDRAAEDFSRTRLRQPCHGYHELER